MPLLRHPLFKIVRLGILKMQFCEHQAGANRYKSGDSSQNRWKARGMTTVRGGGEHRKKRQRHQQKFCFHARLLSYRQNV
jgi:hypothetical protein